MLAQPPQLSWLVDVFTQAVPHQVSPKPQQWPALQTGAEPVQGAPQPPQLLGSVSVFTHCGDAAPQSATPGSVLQVQVPPPQVPRPQAWPQTPQLPWSLDPSTHCGEAVAPQSSTGGAAQVQAGGVPPQVPRVPAPERSQT